MGFALGSAHNHLKKKNKWKLGGPGIRTQVLMVFGALASPLGHLVLFVNILQRKYNKIKQRFIGQNKICARGFELAIDSVTRLCLLPHVRG